MKKAPSGTTRGVFVVDKHGKVLAAEPGGPAPTVEVVRKLVETMGGGGAEKGGAQAENKRVADVAAEVADTAATMDRSKQATPVNG
jgi:peroxiredoxin Q/BCP